MKSKKIKKHYIPNQKNMLNGCIPLKMLRDVECAPLTREGEYFKKGHIYKGWKWGEGPWEYRGDSTHVFKEGDVKALDSKIRESSSKEEFKIPEDLVRWIDEKAKNAGMGRKRFLVELIKYGQYFYLCHRLEEFSPSKSLPEFDLETIIAQHQPNHITGR